MVTGASRSAEAALRRGEPLYDLRTHTWDKTCPCVLAMQVDPECEWHGRKQEGDD